MEFFHVMNRGVDGRVIFNTKSDHLRFIYSLGAFNDRKIAFNTERLFEGNVIHHPQVGRPRHERDPLVDVHAWCLMKNHYHLLLSEREVGDITRFIRKLNIGYAKYFNTRYDRKGALFQGRTKKVQIEHDAHFLHILNYIHLNPLDYFEHSSEWREKKVRNVSETIAYLEKYSWSSLHDYVGESKFPDVATTSFFAEIFPNYRKSLISYLQSLDTSELAQIALE